MSSAGWPTGQSRISAAGEGTARPLRGGETLPVAARRPAALRAAVATEGIHVETASGRAALAVLGDDWDRLLGRQALPSPLLATAWLRETRADDEGATIVLARRGGTLVAGGAFRRARVGPLTLGTWLAGARLPAVLAADDEPDAAREVVAAMLERCHALWLPRVPAAGPTLRAIGSAAPWRRATAVEPPG